MKKVVIVQRRLTHYRVPLFNRLRDLLKQNNIELLLLFGQSTADENKKSDGASLSWATEIPTYYFVNNQLCWQPLERYIKDTHLVVITQENKLLYNHWLLVRPRSFKLAFWGHGANLQTVNPTGFKERYKRWTSCQVDWWFSYTERSAKLVKDIGFSSKRITVLNNSIDTAELRNYRDGLSLQEIQSLRDFLGFKGKRVGIFLGSLYNDKRLNFLLEAAKAVHQQHPDFHLLIIGDGPDRQEVDAIASSEDWVQVVGAKKGREKALYLSLGDLLLCPSAVGLVVLDSFVFSLPLITTDRAGHGPEIAYLESGKNGLITIDNLADYASAICETLNNNNLYNKLREGCVASENTYSIQNMAQRFCDGIIQALESR